MDALALVPDAFSRGMELQTVTPMKLQLCIDHCPWLLQYDVQAAAPLKDSGNDLIAVKGRVIRAIQVKTTCEGGKFGRTRPEHYDLVAFVELRGAGREVNLEDSALYLMPRERDKRRARVESEEWRIGAELIERLFSGDVE